MRARSPQVAATPDRKGRRVQKVTELKSSPICSIFLIRCLILNVYIIHTCNIYASRASNPILSALYTKGAR